MADLERVIDEQRPMLDEFLCEIGLHRAGTPLNLAQLLEPFSNWVDAQEVSVEDRVYLASRLAAFICVYSAEVCSGQCLIDGNRVSMRVPINEGVMREFDPYVVAIGVATNRNSLKAFLETLNSPATQS